MAQESPVSSLHMLKEVRIDIDSGIYDPTIQFLLPPYPTLGFTRAKRLIPKNKPALKTEDEFVRRCLSTESNVFSGRTDVFPRNFLWRILEGGSKLQIRSVDLSKSHEGQAEAANILEFVFPDSIRPGGVAIADALEEDKLSVFALAASNDLYTLDLPRSFFYSASASEGGIERWCKIYKLITLGSTKPHRLLAKNSSELVLGRSDGTVARLTRKKESKNLEWHEVTYNDGKWGSSLRSFVNWQGNNSITLNGTTLEKNTPLALANPPTNNHVWVVDMDHTLKVLNLDSGRTVYKNDLLGIEREPHETAKLLLDPNTRNLIQIFDAKGSSQGDHYYVMTYSPHELGQFKVWAVRDVDEGNRGVRDLYPEDILRAPDPDPSPDSKAIWKMIDFKVTVSRNDGFNIWVLMKSSREYQLYSLKVDSGDFAQGLQWHWQHRWVTTRLEALASAPPPHTSEMAPEGVMESWTEYLLDSNIFPHDLVELALSRYAALQRLDVRSSPKSTLQERVATAMSSTVRLQPRKSGGMDFARYRTELEQEWVVLWQDVQSLSNSRWEVASLAFDDQTQVPWLSCSGGCSVLRTFSKTEFTKLNNIDDLWQSQRLVEIPSTEISVENSANHKGKKKTPVLPDELSMLITIAAELRASFDHDVQEMCDLVLANELWQDPAFSAPLRMQALYNRCRLDTEVSEKAYNRMLSDLRQLTAGPKNPHDLNILFEALAADLPTERSKVQGLFYTRTGLQATVTGAREMIAIHAKFLSDLLLLIVMIEVEAKAELEESRKMNTALWFAEITQLLKQYQVLHWLVTRSRVESPASEDCEGIAGKDAPSLRTSSVLQNLFAKDLTPQPYGRLPQIDTLQEDVDNLLVWATGLGEEGVTFDDALTFIQSNLLLNNNIDLASSFVTFQPSTPFATYLRGRLHLIKGEYSEAATDLKKAAFQLSQATDVNFVLHSNSYLSPTEASQLGQGLPAYYTHILTLFEAARCPSYAITFARLSLQTTSDPTAKSTTLQTIFHASLQTSDFPSAFTSLTRLPSSTATPLIPSFLTSLLNANAFSTALTLPWPPTLRPSIDTFLSSKAATSLPTPTGPQYHKLLASWRLHHLDYRGAAAALLTHLQRVRKSSRLAFAKSGDTDEVIATYLNVINLLACAGEKEADDAWVLTDAFEASPGKKGAPAKKKRKLVTVKDVRAAYQKELDRRSVLESGRWGFGLDGAGDEDEFMEEVDGEGMDVDGE